MAGLIVDFHTNCHCGKDIHATASRDEDVLVVGVQVAGLNAVRQLHWLDTTPSDATTPHTAVTTPQTPPPSTTDATGFTPLDHVQAIIKALEAGEIERGDVASALDLPDPAEHAAAQTPADASDPTASTPTPPTPAAEPPAPRQPRRGRPPGGGAS